MSRIISFVSVLIITVTGLASAASAQSITGEVAPQTTSTITSPFASDAVGTVELGRIAGRADIAQSINAENNATVSRNSVSGNSVTGTIAFDAQAFQNMNGLSVLSGNTGNNVAINSSLNVNVTLHP